MKSIVVGLGIQGKKRKEALKHNFVSSVDPFNSEADFTSLEKVPLDTFDVVFSCVPESFKDEVIRFCTKNAKHLLIEKPLLTKNSRKLKLLEKSFNAKNLYMQTAYNHRYDPNIVRIKNILEKKILGEIYTVRIFYGNGTSSLITKSPWRNSGGGVGIDLGSHIFDLLYYWFGNISFDSTSLKYSYETNCDDYLTFITKIDNNVIVSGQVSYLSWKNTFHCEISGSLGTVFMNSLSKWSDSSLEVRTRIFPSGVPITETYKEPFGDFTWAKEQIDFFANIMNGERTNLSRDIFIQNALKSIINI